MSGDAKPAVTREHRSAALFARARQNRRGEIPVYVCAASRELERVVTVVKALERSGLVRLTFPWWEDVAAWGVGRDHELTDEQRLQHARTDIDGVLAAEIVWVLWPEAPSSGVPFEFGVAYCAGIHTVVSGPAGRRCIFTALADQRLDSDENALMEVLRWAGAEMCSRKTEPGEP